MAAMAMVDTWMIWAAWDSLIPRSFGSPAPPFNAEEMPSSGTVSQPWSRRSGRWGPMLSRYEIQLEVSINGEAPKCMVYIVYNRKSYENG